MDKLLSAIDEGLKRKQLSASAASIAAVGNPSLIKNLRASRDDKKRQHPFENLKALAEVLDLELYIGPPRKPVVTMLQEHSNGFAPQSQMTRHIPWHARHPDKSTPCPLSLTLGWIEARGLVIDNLSAIPAPGDDMAPRIAAGDLLLLEAGIAPTPEPQLFLFQADARLRLGWLLSPVPGTLVAFFDRRYTAPLLRTGSRGPWIDPLARIAAHLGTPSALSLTEEDRAHLADQARAMASGGKT